MFPRTIVSLCISSACILSAATALAQPPGTFTYRGSELTLTQISLQKANRNVPSPELRVRNPFFKSANQDYPLASDEETARAACALIPGSTGYLGWESGAGENLEPSGVVMFRSGELVASGEDPVPGSADARQDPHARPVINILLCSYAGTLDTSPLPKPQIDPRKTISQISIERVTQNVPAPELRIHNPFFKTRSQYFPLFSDEETAKTACGLYTSKGATGYLRYDSAGGPMLKPSGVLKLREGSLEYSGEDPIDVEHDPGFVPVIDTLVCSFTP